MTDETNNYKKEWETPSGFISLPEYSEDEEFLWAWIMRLHDCQTSTEEFLSVVWNYPGNPYLTTQ